MKQKMMSKIAAGLCCILMICSLGACGNESVDHPIGEELNTLLSKLGAAVVEADGTLPEMVVDTSESENAEVAFSAVCDVDYNRVAGFYHAYAAEGTAEEITIICANSKDDVVAIMKSLESHVQLRRGTMENYSPDQVTLVDGYKLTSTDCYVALFISEKSGLDKNNFNSELEANGIQ